MVFAAEGETRGAALGGSSGGGAGKHLLLLNGYGNSFPPPAHGKSCITENYSLEDTCWRSIA